MKYRKLQNFTKDIELNPELVARNANFKHNEMIYKCYAGLTELVVPLYGDSGNYIGCMTTGQFLLDNDECVSDKIIHFMFSPATASVELEAGCQP